MWTHLKFLQFKTRNLQPMFLKFVVFLGLAGYYIRFIPNFSEIAFTITMLTRKDVKFDWSNDCVKSFRNLKMRLTSAPVLTLRYGNDALWSILMHQGLEFGVYLCKMSNSGICFTIIKIKWSKLPYPWHEFGYYCSWS